MADSEDDPNAPIQITIRTIFKADGYVAERVISGEQVYVMMRAFITALLEAGLTGAQLRDWIMEQYADADWVPADWEEEAPEETK